MPYGQDQAAPQGQGGYGNDTPQGPRGTPQNPIPYGENVPVGKYGSAGDGGVVLRTEQGFVVARPDGTMSEPVRGQQPTRTAPPPPDNRRSVGGFVPNTLQGAVEGGANIATRLSPQGMFSNAARDIANVGTGAAEMVGADPERMQNWRGNVDQFFNAPFGQQWAGTPSGAALAEVPGNLAGVRVDAQDSDDRLGRILGNVVAGGFTPGSALQRTAMVAGPTLGAWGGGEGARGLVDAINGTTAPGQPPRIDERTAGNIQQLATIVGGAAGGGAAGLAGPRPATKMTARAMTGLQDDVPAAANLMRESEALPGGGVRLGGDEALAQTNPGAAGSVRSLVRDASNTPAGGNLIAERTAGRPAEIRSTTLGVADQIAPPSVDPAAQGVRANTAANNALSNIRQQTNAPARADYDALPGQSIPPEALATIQANPTYARALAEVRGNPELNSRIANLPDNNLAVVNEVMKRMGTLEDAARQSPTNPGGDNTLAGIRAQSQGETTGLLRALESEGRIGPEFGRARQTVAEGRQNVLEPAQNGPLGGVSRSTDPIAQALELYPRAPPEGMANNTVSALQGLDAQAPGTGAGLTRTRLVDALNTGTRRLQGGDPPMGGANVANQIAGNAEQGATFRAGVGQVAPDAVPNVDTLMQALQASGTRLPPGSPTARNLEGLADMAEVGPGLRTAQVVSRPWKIWNELEDFAKWGAKQENATGVVNNFSPEATPAGGRLMGFGREIGVETPGGAGVGIGAPRSRADNFEAAMRRAQQAGDYMQMNALLRILLSGTEAGSAND